MANSIEIDGTKSSSLPFYIKAEIFLNEELNVEAEDDIFDEPNSKIKLEGNLIEASEVRIEDFYLGNDVNVESWQNTVLKIDIKDEDCVDREEKENIESIIDIDEVMINCEYYAGSCLDPIVNGTELDLNNEPVYYEDHSYTNNRLFIPLNYLEDQQNIENQHPKCLFGCSECPFTSELQLNVDLHKLTHSDPNGKEKNKCNQRSYQTNRELFITDHNIDDSKSRSNGNPPKRPRTNTFRCFKCSYKSNNIDFVVKHISSKHKNSENFNSDECQLSTSHNENQEDFNPRGSVSKLTEIENIENDEYQLCSSQNKTQEELLSEINAGDTDELPSDNLETLKRDKCSYTTKNKQHLKGHFVPKFFQCSQCSFKTNYQHSLRKHCFGRHSRLNQLERFTCSMCSYTAINKDDLDEHFITCKLETLKCGKCSYTTKYGHVLDQHFLTHDQAEFSKRNYQAEDENFASSRNTDTLVHNLFGCSECTYTTESKRLLGIHVRFRHRYNSEKLSCDKCNFVTESKFSLKTHNELHIDPVIDKLFRSNNKNDSDINPELSSNTHSAGSRQMEVSNSSFKTVDKRYLTLKCNKCEFGTKFEQSLNVHNLRKHTSNPNQTEVKTLEHGNCSYKTTLLECSKCTFKTKYEQSLSLHNSRKHSSNRTTTELLHCRDCSYKTVDKRYLRQHRYIHHDPKTLKCNKCAFETKYNQSLRFHNLRRHTPTPTEVEMLLCTKCSYKTQYKLYLQKHMLRRHHPFKLSRKKSNKTFKCENCSFVTKYEISLKYHRLKHMDASEVEMLHCTECSYETKDERYLKQHLVIHANPSSVKMFKCTECSFQSKYKQSLNLHNSRKHSSNCTKAEMLHCKDCSFKTITKRSLRQHFHVYHDPKTLKCTKCAFETKYKHSLRFHNLRQHTPTPTEVEMLLCTKCSYKTQYKLYLQKHMLRRHHPFKLSRKKSNKTFKCENCSFVTKYEVSLKYHRLKHMDASEVEMLHCTQCSYETKDERYLKQHLVIHANPSSVKMFKCTECSFQSKYKQSLNLHNKVLHTINAVFRCGKCDFEGKRSSLRKHRLLNHRTPKSLLDIKLKNREFECNNCSFVTRHKSVFIKHIKFICESKCL